MTQVYEIGRKVMARIPTDYGQFRLALYHNSLDDKEHLALIYGEVAGEEEVLVRVHSECFTGDVLGSNRCDCGEQLHLSMERIAAAERGVIVYLRQEGRGIGLLEKLRAYNLQDEGYDTVDANLLLGHAEDEREYSAAAAILADLGVETIRLLTNNPTKVESLTELGVDIAAREPLAAQHITPDSALYLKTKVQRMRHLLDLGQVEDKKSYPALQNGYHPPESLVLPFPRQPLDERPFVTLTYAQTLDGSIAAQSGQPLPISGPESLTLTHQLRATHDGILVGIGTVLADDPRLNVRLVPGSSPRPVILDSQLRLPLSARLLHSRRKPIVATVAGAPAERKAALEAAGVQILTLPATPSGQVALSPLLLQLRVLGMESLMVEGGAAVIGSFLAEQLVDGVVLTVSPQFLGGVKGLSRPLLQAPPQLRDPQTAQLGEDIIVWGMLN